MTEKQKYIGAFLDGYFVDKKFAEYGMAYISELSNATKLAEKKWKKYKKQFTKP
jgi:hypothetical protein